MVEVNMGKVKDLYIGTFQFRHSTFIERAYAYSDKQAYMIICRRIAKKQGVEPWVVLKHFSGNSQDCIVKKEFEFEEVET